MPTEWDASAILTIFFSIAISRERLIRLQHENKMLKLQRAETEDEQGQLLQGMLDDANARKNELESEVRWVQGGYIVVTEETLEVVMLLDFKRIIWGLFWYKYVLPVAEIPLWR